jgi:hypothetical protein
VPTPIVTAYVRDGVVTSTRSEVMKRGW